MTFTKTFSLWPILPYGCEDQDGNENGSDNNDSENATDNSQDNNDGNQTQTKDDKEDDPYEGLSAKELKRLLAESETKLTSAVSERDTAKSELTAKEREKLDKEQRLELEVEELKTKNAAVVAINEKLAITNAIGNDQRFTWHNTDLVTAQLNREIVKVDDDGNVSGLAKELTRIAKEFPYLIKTDANGSTQTGVQPGQGGANSGNLEQSKQELAKKYPALASCL